MGMTAGFVQITPEQLQSHIDNPNTLQDVIMSAIMGGGGSMSVDKAWHGIHFLLTGDSWENDSPLAQVVMGGAGIGEDMGFGPARYLTAEEVEQIAAALQPIDADEFSSRYDPEAMESNGVYAFNMEDADDEIDYFRGFYLELRDYYFDAAAKGNAMLAFMV